MPILLQQNLPNGRVGGPYSHMTLNPKSSVFGHDFREGSPSNFSNGDWVHSKLHQDPIYSKVDKTRHRIVEKDVNVIVNPRNHDTTMNDLGDSDSKAWMPLLLSKHHQESTL